MKVEIAITLRNNLIVGARSFADNPYDANTLAEQIQQASILMQDTDVQRTTIHTDPRYRSVDKETLNIHLNHDHRMDRCRLKGQLGDAMHAILCATGYNIKWPLRLIIRYELRAFLRPFLVSQLSYRYRNYDSIIGFPSRQRMTYVASV